MRRFWLWLIAHGIEIEIGDSAYAYKVRSFSIAINHRFYGVDFALIISPFSGVYDDELDTPHAEIAEIERQKHEREDKA